MQHRTERPHRARRATSSAAPQDRRRRPRSRRGSPVSRPPHDASLTPTKTLRRPDEYGALAEWETIATHAATTHGLAGCFLCLSDMSTRPPRPLADGEVLDIGGHRLRWLDTPHVPGPWEAGVLYDESTATLFCG